MVHIMALQDLVFEYKKNPNNLTKGRIIEEALPLIYSIVAKIKHPNSPLCEKDDLVNIGATGLLQSLDNFDTTKDVKFNTFAYYRIRGSIIDYLRSLDELSRTNRSRYGAAQNAIAELQQKLGRTPFNHEVADALGMSTENYEQLLSYVQKRVALSLDMEYSDEQNVLSNHIEDEMYESPDARILEEESSQQLKNAIRRLKERDQLILSLYFYEEYNLREIADTLDLSEARISQIIGKLLITLKGILEKPDVVLAA